MIRNFTSIIKDFDDWDPNVIPNFDDEKEWYDKIEEPPF